uniref:Uncharacterized protein MANES_S087600 n=1 Tax=Rhizophora mucronata TaxID=61149 RepID=A0A2P2NLG2_RHIMU
MSGSLRPRTCLEKMSLVALTLMWKLGLEIIRVLLGILRRSPILSGTRCLHSPRIEFRPQSLRLISRIRIL